MESLPVTVGIDELASTTAAVRWAAAAAARRAVDLQIIAAGWAGQQHADRDDFTDQALQEVRASAESALRAAEAAALSVSGKLVVRTGFVPGLPLRALTAAATLSQLVVVGRHRAGHWTRLLIGSVATDLPEHSRCPVVVVPDGFDSRGGPVVVGVGDGWRDRAVVEAAAAEATTFGTELVAVQAWDHRSRLTLPAQQKGEEAVVQRQEHALLLDRLQPVLQEFPDLVVVDVVDDLRDAPSAVLYESAQDARLVVVGTRGRGAVKGAVLGSTSRAVIERATCPVMVVPT